MVIPLRTFKLGPTLKNERAFTLLAQPSAGFWGVDLQRSQNVNPLRIDSQKTRGFRCCSLSWAGGESEGEEGRDREREGEGNEKEIETDTEKEKDEEEKERARERERGRE